MTTCGSLLVFRKNSRAPFALPLGPIIPVLGIGFAVFLLSYTKLEEVYFTLGGIALGSILYFIVKRDDAKDTA
jgi:amino acid transporter